ncbi:hypothetical protein HNQ80_000898 [Anaerosolibacter carboniphilus]|uniref:Uncharacterized protein n=1 Tax=Anaerosolibacter carboniphilus TaxID=1417629 RepID=A0A841KN38_9FIRM|nr:hypothetical protein [Anaerosolibacter carboniphilus]MBB6214813.1 hypothetical protein [Anaerosolibacter carboniphilus]
MYRQTPSGCGISLYTPGVIPEELREQFGNACELVCVQIPKVYDSCLLRLCLVGDCEQEDLDQGIVFDPNLRFRIDCSADDIINARVEGLVPGSFRVISRRSIPGDTNRKLISYTYQLRILYDVVFDDGTVSTDNELLLRRSETVGPLYCPEPAAIIRETGRETIDEEIIKLEIVARVLDARVAREDCNSCDAYDPYENVCCAEFTVGIYNVIKCELEVQLVIPAFGFCPPPAPCERRPDRPVCEDFNEELPPAFFPPQLDDFITGPGIGF